MAVTPSGWVVFGILFVWAFIGLVIGAVVPTLPGPPAGYAEWTKLAIGVLGAAIGAKVLWKLPETIKELVQHK